jgi:hypothetical protein
MKLIAMDGNKEADRTLDEPGCTDGMVSLAWSPDGKTLAGIDGGNRLKVWDVASGKLRNLGAANWQVGACWLDKGRTLAAWSDRPEQQGVTVWDVAEGKPLRRFGTYGSPWCIDFAPKTGLFTTFSPNGMQFRSLADGEVIRTVAYLRNKRHLVVSPEGHWRGPAGVESELRYIALTDAGQETLTLEEFEKKFGWRNDPDKVGLKPDGGQRKDVDAKTSVASGLIFRVQVLEFCPGVVGSELPIDSGLLAIAFVLPSGGLVDQRLFVGNPTGQALTSEDVQFDFRHIEPTAVLRRVDHFDPMDNATGFLGRERFVERTQTVRVEVVHHERDPFGLWSMNVDQFADFVSPVGLGPLVGHRDVPPTGQRLGEGEDVGCAVPHIFVVEALRASRLGGQWRLRFDGQLLAQLVHADQREPGIVGTLIGFQHVFHVEHKLGVVLWRNAPHALLPGLQLVFLRHWRTVSWEIDSTISNSTTRSASSRNVQRA